eukprot:1176825-Prorocentrum_minimum.AAC.1
MQSNQAPAPYIRQHFPPLIRNVWAAGLERVLSGSCHVAVGSGRKSRAESIHARKLSYYYYDSPRAALWAPGCTVRRSDRKCPAQSARRSSSCRALRGSGGEEPAGTTQSSRQLDATWQDTTASSEEKRYREAHLRASPRSRARRRRGIFGAPFQGTSRTTPP